MSAPGCECMTAGRADASSITLFTLVLCAAVLENLSQYQYTGRDKCGEMRLHLGQERKSSRGM
jgi:hypothetical protein